MTIKPIAVLISNDRVYVNLEMEIENKKVKSLKFYVDDKFCGWIWRTEEPCDLGLVFIRCLKSDIAKEFLKDILKQIEWKEFKVLLADNLLSSGYAVFGDNQMWQFGSYSDLESVKEFLESVYWDDVNCKLTKEQKEDAEQFIYDHATWEYSEFYEGFGYDLLMRLKKVILDSENFDQVLDYVNSEDYSYDNIEALMNYAQDCINVAYCKWFDKEKARLTEEIDKDLKELAKPIR